MTTTIEIEDIWSQVLEAMRPELNKPVFRTWIEHAVPTSMSADGVLVVAVETQFARDWFEGQYSNLLCSALSTVTGIPSTVNVVVDPSKFASVPAADAGVTAEVPRPEVALSERAPETESAFNPKYTFDSFVVGDSNRLAATAALAVADEPGVKYNPLFLWGGPGLGKTHLLHAIANHVAQHYPGKNVIYVTSERFTNDYINSMASRDNKRIDRFRQRYRQADVLLIDDVQFLKGKEGTLEEFFNTFNWLKDLGKAIVLSSDRAPKDIDIEERFRSRFASGLAADISPPNLETRVAILKRWSETEGLPIPDEVLMHIAEASMACNIREMEGAMTRISAWHSLSGRPIDIDLVKEATMGLFPERSTRPISVPTIQRECCRYFQITHAEMVGSKRSQHIVYPRQVAMYLARELTDMSLPKIGEEFGNRDHTTVMHATKKIGELMRSQREVYNQVQSLTNAIKEKS
jgi:chromosomal replication initiator protein